ncbi:uncharacterized protein BX664DRAFT_341249 [Halteromyces radiatus]|uniref:uncharacterized protein n=1 Tax=Halteromyces radiatus TaxID=101107 RepID=UPI00221E5E25|nr:uncharacterized protein BX664DRAFT_341249 [Halteromyces radiatus]KAI8081768.1 hypothetical protein BX664DRAFT_341249 [Halteromyces radiatus]
MTHLIKKQEEQDMNKIKQLLRLPDNKRCFDCAATSPFFVDMTIQTFICARCSGLVREVGHRVKSISTSKFSGPETTSLEMGGNTMAKRIWLHGFHSELEWIESDYDVRLFMRQKYYEQRWLDRALWKEHGEKIIRTINELYTEDGLRRQDLSSTRRLSVKTSPTSINFILPPPPTSPNSVIKQQHSNLLNNPNDDHLPLGLTTVANNLSQKHSIDLLADNNNNPWMNTPVSPSTTNTTTTTMTQQTSTLDDIWSTKVKKEKKKKIDSKSLLFFFHLFTYSLLKLDKLHFNHWLLHHLPP